MAGHAAIPLTKFALSSFTTAIKTLYGVTVELNNFLDDHIDSMKKSDNITISRVGNVLEGAKFGFGLGYLSSVVILCVGQLLLGNTLAAIAEVATAATLTNPIAMTCAAVGAIYFGWNALTDDERNHILEKIETGLEIGKELVKSIILFVIDIFKKINDSKIISELKKDIQTAALYFGKNVSDITRKTSDKAIEIKDKISHTVTTITNEVVDTAMNLKGKKQKNLAHTPLIIEDNSKIITTKLEN